ncbi:hypothetical protein PIB30_057471 [Stylosanthes scabra]|uniref:Uncharacterized protein n=1 Tax=Stylosanthes scabra TaxID=79078 RepID=A0ABU6RJV0_9FABA|nr:hypothetical protein [Stylosanthes scabra]
MLHGSPTAHLRSSSAAALSCGTAPRFHLCRPPAALEKKSCPVPPPSPAVFKFHSPSLLPRGTRHTMQKGTNPMGSEYDLKLDGALVSSGSCPFPPGFGPCSDRVHIHREMPKAQTLPHSVKDTPAAIVDGVAVSAEPKNTSDSPVGEVVVSSTNPISEEVGSNETLYKINVEEWRIREIAESVEGEESDENHVLGVGHNEGDEVEHYETLSDSSTLRLNTGTDAGVHDRDEVAGCNEIQGDIVKLAVESKEIGTESSEEGSLLEVVEAKGVWGRGGLSFNSSDEEEVIARLVKRRPEGKKRSDFRPKKQCQGKRPPCLQGRTLTTRKLRLGAKPKLK